MTIECLRARLLAERSTAKAAKLKIEELEKKVTELERKLQLEIEKRKNAEAALQDSLEKMLDSPSNSASSVSTDSELESFSRATTSQGARARHSSGESAGRQGVSNRGSIDQSVEEGYNSEDFAEAKQHKVKEESGAEQASSTHGAQDLQDLQSQCAPSGENAAENVKAPADFPKDSETGEPIIGLPCAECLEPHIHSDSDWATDDGKQSSSFATTECGDLDSEGDAEQHNERFPLPTQLHLAQLDFASKIGKSLRSFNKSRRKKKTRSCRSEASSDMTGWVNQVVHMLEKEIGKEHSVKDDIRDLDPSVDNRQGGEVYFTKGGSHALETAEHDSGVPYVSFVKYLGLNSLERFIQVERSSEGTIWKINGAVPEEPEADRIERSSQGTTWKIEGLMPDSSEASGGPPAENTGISSHSAISLNIPLQQNVGGKGEYEGGFIRHRFNLRLNIGIKPLMGEEQEGVPKQDQDSVCTQNKYNSVGTQNKDDSKECDGAEMNERSHGQDPNKYQRRLLEKLQEFRKHRTEVMMNCEAEAAGIQCGSAEIEQAPEITGATTATPLLVDDKMEEIFRALNAAKKQLRSSLERRQVLEKQLMLSC